MSRLAEIGGKRLPFLRWSFLRMALGLRTLTSEWQVGDGREEALCAYVVEHARAGDIDDVIRVIDEFCYERSFMINVGDEKGELLDAALRRAGPRLILELGTYCGYSALRLARAMPDGARVVSVEFNGSNAAIARRIRDHAGLTDQVGVVVGTLGDGGGTIGVLEAEHGFAAGAVGFAFLDHDKGAYLPDLERILQRGWSRRGRRRRQRQVPGRARVPGVHGRAGRAHVAHCRARDPRRISVTAQRSRARVGVPGRGSLIVRSQLCCSSHSRNSAGLKIGNRSRRTSRCLSPETRAALRISARARRQSSNLGNGRRRHHVPSGPHLPRGSRCLRRRRRPPRSPPPRRCSRRGARSPTRASTATNTCRRAARASGTGKQPGSGW